MTQLDQKKEKLKAFLAQSKILIVDSQKFRRELLVSAFSTFSPPTTKIVTAHSVDQGISKFLSYQSNIILSEVTSSGTSNFSLCQVQSGYFMNKKIPYAHYIVSSHVNEDVISQSSAKEVTGAILGELTVASAKEILIDKLLNLLYPLPYQLKILSALELLDHGENEKVMEILDEAITSNPRSSEAYALKAHILEENNQVQEACELYAQGFQVNKNDYNCLQGSLSCFESLKDWHGYLNLIIEASNKYELNANTLKKSFDVLLDSKAYDYFEIFYDVYLKHVQDNPSEIKGHNELTSLTRKAMIETAK